MWAPLSHKLHIFITRLKLKQDNCVRFVDYLLCCCRTITGNLQLQPKTVKCPLSVVRCPMSDVCCWSQFAVFYKPNAISVPHLIINKLTRNASLANSLHLLNVYNLFLHLLFFALFKINSYQKSYKNNNFNCCTVILI